MIFSNKQAVASVKVIGEDDDLALEGYFPGFAVLSGINSTGKGHASEVLRAVCQWADSEGCRLVLCPVASGELSQEALVSCYERNGFRQDDAGMMIR